jgi:hypothetical protein
VLKEEDCQITTKIVPFRGRISYVGAAISNFNIAVFYLLRGGKSATQTFSFSVRIRRDWMQGRFIIGIVHGLD